MVNPEEVFWVMGTFYLSPDENGIIHTSEEMIGVVYMRITCWQDMPPGS